LELLCGVKKMVNFEEMISGAGGEDPRSVWRMRSVQESEKAESATDIPPG
jgi:hypothetical protein